MAKIAVSCVEPRLDSFVEPRFGRALGFMIVDPDTMHFEFLENGLSQTMAQGAGVKAAEKVARSGASVVLTGFVGPRAFQALCAAGLEVGQNLDGLTVKQAVEKYKAGGVGTAAEPNRKAHWK